MKKKTQKPAKKVIITKFNPAKEIINYIDEVVDIVTEIGFWKAKVFNSVIGDTFETLIDNLIDLPHAKHVAEALYESDEKNWLDYEIGNPPFNFIRMAEEVLKWKRENEISDYDFMEFFMALYAECQWCSNEVDDPDPYYDLKLTEQEMRDIQEEYKSMVKFRCKSKKRRKEILSKIREMEQECKLWTPDLATETLDGEIYEICGQCAGGVIKDLLTRFDEKTALWSFMASTPREVSDPSYKWSNFSSYFTTYNYEYLLKIMFPDIMKISGKEIFEAIEVTLMKDFAERMAYEFTSYSSEEHKAIEAIKQLNERTKERLLNGEKNEGK